MRHITPAQLNALRRWGFAALNENVVLRRKYELVAVGTPAFKIADWRDVTKICFTERLAPADRVLTGNPFYRSATYIYPDERIVRALVQIGKVPALHIWRSYDFGLYTRTSPAEHARGRTVSYAAVSANPQHAEQITTLLQHG